MKMLMLENRGPHIALDECLPVMGPSDGLKRILVVQNKRKGSKKWSQVICFLNYRYYCVASIFLSSLMHKYASFRPYSSHFALYFINECLQLKWKEVWEVEPKCFNQKKKRKKKTACCNDFLWQYWRCEIELLVTRTLSHMCCLTCIGNDTRLLLPSIRNQGSETQLFFPTPWPFGEKKYAKLNGADRSIQGGKKNRSSSWEQKLHHNELFVRLFPVSPPFGFLVLQD